VVTASKLFAAKSRIGPTAEVPREATARAALSDGSVYLEAALFACRRANAICSSEYSSRFMASPFRDQDAQKILTHRGPASRVRSNLSCCSGTCATHFNRAGRSRRRRARPRTSPKKGHLVLQSDHDGALARPAPSVAEDIINCGPQAVVDHITYKEIDEVE